MDIIEELNFEPDILASTLASKRNFRFAVLFPDANNESTFWNAPQLGIGKALQEINHYGITVELFLFNQFEKESFEKKAEELIKSEPDAFLIAPFYYDASLKVIEEANKMNIPFAFVNSNLEDVESISYIGQDSFQSGIVAAKIMSMAIPEVANLLVVNISRSIKNHKHILKRKNGFYSYFQENKSIRLNSLDIEREQQEDVFALLDQYFIREGKPHGIFVTNSRVFKIGNYLKEKNIEKIFLIGYDLTEENVSLLQDCTIDFLISQKPVDQGYKGIMSLFQHVILKKEIEKEQYLPIDIITKENIKYYLNN